MMKTFNRYWALFACFAFVCAMPVVAEDNPRQLIDAAIKLLAERKTWAFPELPSLLTIIISKYPTSREAITAKLMMASYLTEAGDARSLEKAEALVEDLLKVKTWHRYLAAFDYVNILGLKNNFSKQIDEAERLLRQFDFNLLESETDGDFLAIKKVFKIKKHEISDSIKLLLALAYCKAGKSAEAVRVQKTMGNFEYVHQIESEIKGSDRSFDTRDIERVAIEEAMKKRANIDDGRKDR